MRKFHSRSQFSFRRYYSSSPFYDITIVGGGSAGGVLACALASSSLTCNLKIAVIDTKEHGKMKK